MKRSQPTRVWSRCGVAVALAMTLGLCSNVLPADATVAPARASVSPGGHLGAATVAASARRAVGAVLVAVARNQRGSIRRHLGTGPAATSVWRALRDEHAWQVGLPTTPPSLGGPWRRAGAAWAKPGAVACYRGYCSVVLVVNAIGSDGPYTTLYVKRARGKATVVATRDIGPQDGFDYVGAYWACTRRAVNLTNPTFTAGSQRTSRLRLRRGSLVQVGSYYMQQASDPQRGVRFSRVVEGYVVTSALLRVPGTVSGEAKARMWCSSRA